MELSLASDRKSKPKPFVQCQVRRLETKSMQAPSCREQVEICHVLNFLALLFPISFLNGHHARQDIHNDQYIDD